MRVLLSCLLLSALSGTAFADVKEDVAKLEVATLTKAVEFYKLKKEKYPEKLKDLIDAGIVEPKATLLDPWGNAYQYDAAGKKNAGKRPDIWTKTPDGEEIGNWPPAAKEPKK